MDKQKNTLLNIKTTFKEIGFGSKSFSDLDRLILQDGSFNVERKGIGWKGFSLYHWLINMRWGWLMVFGFTAYLVVNFLFAMIYYLFGPNQLSGSVGLVGQDLFLRCFYFSTQTLTTVGYGGISPIARASSLIAAFEAMIGLLSFAFATSIIYGRFSKAKAKIIFSKQMVISPYQGIKGLKFRIANPKKNQLIEMSARVMYSYLDHSSGQSKRKYVGLNLEIDAINMFPLPWTIVHAINEDSPLYGKSREQLLKDESEFIILLKGYDDTFSQYVHQIYSYRTEDILFSHDFEPMFDAGLEKSTTVHLNKISKTRRV